MVVPDYANQETINRIPTNNGEWIVDRMGFVFCNSITTGTAQSGIIIKVNGKKAFHNFLYPSTQHDVGTIVAVAMGDVVSIQAVGTVTGISCCFIPPKLVAKELPVVVEKNGSYSLDEIKTADTWINGKPIYKRTFTGAVTVAANTWLSNYEAGSIGTNIDTAVEIKGSFNRGNNQWFPIIMTDHNADFSVKQTSFAVVRSDGFVFWNSYISVARTNSPYYITVYYTKTTD
jgi:hypothetical protein